MSTDRSKTAAAKSGRRLGPTTYADAGVDVRAGRRAVEMIREKVRSTFRPEVVGDIGGFGGLFAFDASKYRDPVLVSSTDGVGTKVLMAQQMGVHDTIGIDLVAMSVNDVAAQGAEPLFFLDYIVIEKVVEQMIDEIVRGIVAGCREAGCALIGGEIAEHRGHMLPGSYDLAGFCVGAVEREALVTGANSAPGDVVVGIESSGLHSNGFSLVRKVLLEDMGLKLDDRPMELASTLGEELLRPTTIYSPVVSDLTREVAVKGLAHVTTGGIPGNLARIVPPALEASIDRKAWEVPGIFSLIRALGRVTSDEMFSTFNMGIGMIAVVGSPDANRTLDIVRGRGHRAHEIGVISPAGRRDLRVRMT